MPLIQRNANNPQYQMRMDDTKHVYLLVTITDLYVTGGIIADLQSVVHGWVITRARFDQTGGFSAEWSAETKKLVIYKGGIEVENGHSFYDTPSGKYLSFFVEAIHISQWNPELLIDPTHQIQNEITSDNRMLRKDADDSFQPNVTTTVPETSTLVIQGEQKIETTATSEVKGELLIADGGVQTVQSGGTTTVESGATSNIAGTQNIQAGATQTIDSGGTVSLAPGATQNIAGNIINVPAGTFPAGTTQSVANGSFFVVDGTITPNIDTLTGGTEGKSIVIQCIAGTTTLHHGSAIDLVADVDFVMKVGDSVSLKYESGIWKEPVGRVVKDGSSTVASGGTTTILPGATVSTGGTIVKTNAIIFPAGGSSPSIAGGNLFVVDGTITDSLVNFVDGQNGIEFTLYCVGGAVVLNYNPSYMVLKGKTNLTMHINDSISFRMEDGVWVEQTSNIKVGWVPINDTGMVMVYTGGVVNNGGVEVKTPITPPSAGTLDASKNSQFSLDPAVTPSITNILGNGTDYQIVGMGVKVGTTGTCTIYSNANIQLTKGSEFVMVPGDGITLQKQDTGIWKEIQRVDINSAVSGKYNTFTWSANVTLNPTSLDMLYTTVTSDGTIGFANLTAGLTVILGLQSDNITTHTISFGANTTFLYSAIILTPNHFAMVNCYCTGSTWQIGEPRITN